MNQQPPLRGAQHFEAAATPDDEALKGAARFEGMNVTPESEAKLAEALEPLDGHLALQGLKGKPWSTLAKWALTGLGLLAITETVLTLTSAYQQSPWLFALYAAVLGLVLAWGGRLVLSEVKLLRRLKAADDARERAQRIRQSVQTGEAALFIQSIERGAPAEALGRFNAMVNEFHNDAEVLTLYEECVLSAQDAEARKLVSRYAMESAALLAASPLAVLDMAIILWRNQKLIRDVAACYGVELGYWSRIRLIRAILVNIFYAGTTELVTDLGSQLLSVEMTGKLSARLAQGLGGGLLTARLGYQAMALCRPLSFRPENKPKLSRIYKELLAELKRLFGGVLTGQLDGGLLRNKNVTKS